MGRGIKIFAGIITAPLMLIILSGCSAPSKKQDVEKTSSLKQQQQVMITTGKRFLPESCKAGETITVKIEVIPANQVSGVIVAEKIPEGWKITNSNPQVSRIEQGSVYKWLEWASQVSLFTINYQVKVPDTAKGEYFFEGSVMTYREGEIEIIGDRRIIVK